MIYNHKLSADHIIRLKLLFSDRCDTEIFRFHCSFDSCATPEAAEQLHSMTQPPPCSTAGVIFPVSFVSTPINEALLRFQGDILRERVRLKGELRYF